MYINAQLMHSELHNVALLAGKSCCEYGEYRNGMAVVRHQS